MTDTTVNEPAKPTHVQIDPMAAAGEYAALNAYYRDRNLVLANELAVQRGHSAMLEAQIENLRTELEQRNKDLEAAQKTKRSA
ncbi:hypothetical protein F9K96_05595 [Brucella anthropi]|uniref:hypothetical protein n=1 Tax=Brucella anthropi TaxID=529 RepID=UPI00124F272C|nr:hypothetical protein [Brucella anthropi]KAB2792610.1 hypothetical protein F9K96_05595 [Brucella anthropi]DAE48877.1 MAG TPA: protein of unknown function (DUF5320) [Caudoviricetes sp.]